MSSVVVTTQGALLRHERGQVRVELEGEVLQRFPETQVERVLILGRAQLSSGFLELAFRARIPVTFLTQDGAFKGRLDPGDRRDVALRLAQYRGLENPAWRLENSRPLVAAKIAGQRGVLLRAARNHPHPALDEAAGALAALADELPDAASLPQLMGREGAAARAYFAAFPHLLRTAHSRPRWRKSSRRARAVSTPRRGR
jgi:CRISPR-associated protein Cas1